MILNINSQFIDWNKRQGIEDFIKYYKLLKQKKSLNLN